MGTDEYGRDILSRVIWGSRVSVFVGFLAVGLGTTVGALLGLFSGYIGGWFDYCVQRVVDMLMAFPMLILALAMVSVLGAAIHNVIIALAIVIMPNACRVIRSSVLSLRQRPYVEASYNLGFSHLRIIFGQIMPNAFATYIILATAGLGNAILSEAALSFLGLGTPAPEPSWGGMLSGRTQGLMVEAPWLAIFPGLAITLVVFGFNFLGDALRDLLDPRLRNR
jgi:peptide/nickel transport system permease protein